MTPMVLCGKSIAFEIQLLAESLSAGGWGVLNTVNWDSSLTSQAPFDITNYSHNMCWDSINKSIWYVGAGHVSPKKMIEYVASTNTWVALGLIGLGASTHSYDQQTFYDDLFYLLGNDSGNPLYRWNGSAWTTLASANFENITNEAMALEAFPDRDKIYAICPSGSGMAVKAFDITAGTWAAVDPPSPETYFGYSANPIACYSAVHGVLVIASGNYVYTIDSDGVVTRMGSPPISIGSSSTTISADPTSGGLLVLFSTGAFYSYNPITDTWTSGLSNPYSLAPSSTSGTLSCPVSDYGVVLFTQVTPTYKIYLYKHAE